MSSPVENMISDLAKREFLVFAGAGMSVDTGIKKWRELLKELNKLAPLNGVDIDKVDPSHFPEIAQMIYNSLENKKQIHYYYDTIRECMQPTQCRWHSGHQKILKVSTSIATTNLDSVFEKAMMDELKNSERGWQQVAYQTLGELSIDNVMKSYHVTYIHGRHDKKEIILKTIDYMKYYRNYEEKESETEKILKEIFCREVPNVFLGFSFGDRFILNVFERAFEKLKRSAIDKPDKGKIPPEYVKHYALIDDPIDGGEDRENWLRRNRGNIKEGSKEEKEIAAVDRREELETRLQNINIEIIRYEHEKHIQVESWFEQIHSKKRNAQDFIRQKNEVIL